ncbi:MAG: 5'/3'-nucleotidase SurE [Planctomycetota bacterium]|nr:5'/3'-nucleotidase SurE [Planctomycetota bacterium]MCX8040662.1 5'/3'-nucleotidase SurE [Planctomycetota bacterium]MDW8372805.1 5'/3'-nucleotidase SurE [Planctomycetota bacterium]
MLLLVNDDGIAAPGLRQLYAALRARLGEPVLCVAPLRERSGQSHAITIDRELAVLPRLEDGFFGFAVDGTPADCVKLALDRLCPCAPRLVISGINDGPNVGRSIFYSGTVGAAMEAAIAGYPALAVSRMPGGVPDAATAARIALWVERFLAAGPWPPLVVNLNVPASAPESWRALRCVRHGLGGFRERYRPLRDGGRTVWRLDGEWRGSAADDDAAALTLGHPVCSVLVPDMNDDERRQRVAAVLVEA